MNRPKGSGSGAGDGKASTGDKEFGLTLLDVIRPSQAALTDPGCGNLPTGLAELRTNEMNARISGLTAALDAKSMNLRVTTLEISVSDCEAFNAIEGRAAKAQPDPDLSDNQLKSKPAVHVRLVVWFGDSSRRLPSGAVLNNEWADMTRLSALGIARRLSLNHFALLGSNSGYVSTWQRSSDPTFNFLANMVTDPVPTDAGFAAVLNSATAATASFIAFLHQKALGI